MTIRLSCPSCNQTMQLPDNAAGKRARCPHCKDVIAVPLASTPTPAKTQATGSQPTAVPRPVTQPTAAPTPARAPQPLPSNDLFRDLPTTTAAPRAISPAAKPKTAANPYAAAANPYAAPTQTYTPANAAGSSSGASANVPGTALMIVSGIHLGLIFLGLIINIIGWVVMATGGQGNAVPGAELAILIVMQLAMNAVAIGIQGTVFMGAKAMVNHRNLGLAYASAIISLIPCIGSSLVILGLPFGIWALVALGNPDVQRRFR